MRLQAHEEYGRAMMIFDDALERSRQVKLDAIDTPPARQTTLLAIFTAAQAYAAFLYIRYPAR